MSYSIQLLQPRIPTFSGKLHPNMSNEITNIKHVYNQLHSIPNDGSVKLTKVTSIVSHHLCSIHYLGINKQNYSSLLYRRCRGSYIEKVNRSIAIDTVDLHPSTVVYNESLHGNHSATCNHQLWYFCSVFCSLLWPKNAADTLQTT